MAPVCLIPIGKTPRLDELKGELEIILGDRVEVGEEVELPASAYNPRRRQYLAEEILGYLPIVGPEKKLGVVDVDLYTPGLNFVFGLALPEKGVAVIALPRLRQEYYGLPPDEGLFLARMVKEAVHELGHLFGLRHCQDRRCVMSFSNSLADTDKKGKDFCSGCRPQVR